MKLINYDINDEFKMIITIKNSQPIGLFDLTSSFIVFAKQFNYYVNNTTDNIKTKETKLCISDIKSGSIVIDLIDVALQNIMPFMSEINTIASFYMYFSEIVKYYKGEIFQKPNLSKNECRYTNEFFSPIAGDINASCNIEIYNITQNISCGESFINSINANAIQNRLNNEIKNIEVPEELLKKHVIMTWHQATNQDESSKYDKGIIEEISQSPKIIIAEENIKQRMISGKYNPFNMAYDVDVIIQTAKGKIFSYKIVDLHTITPINE